jgi:hypothetical protein
MLDYPPILIPCYSESSKSGSEDILVENALVNGKLFDCDPCKAEVAYVFARGFIDSEKVKNAIALMTGLSLQKIYIWRKLSKLQNNDLLILLRNPYGDNPDAYKARGTLENRLYRIIKIAIGYIDEFRDEIIQSGNPERTNEALETYFSGENGLKSKLEDTLKRFESGDKYIFRDELRIICGPEDQHQMEMDLQPTAIIEKEIRDLVMDILIEHRLIK